VNKKILIVIVLILPVAGALGGYLAGPFVARVDDRVRLAARIWKEESRGLTERTFESEVFREEGGSPWNLYRQARRIERRMCIAAALFGAWCGLVVSFQLGALMRVEKRPTYEIEQGQCVACARCFHTCPIEKEARRERQQWSPGDEKQSHLRRLLNWLEESW
jgi:NAD-dependent dihydropyrimidine dehydrogenase PreA subunit